MNSTYAEQLAYVENPNSSDFTCINEVKRAKIDIANGKIIFSQNAGFLYGQIRYEEELRNLCKDNGLIFDFELMGCEVIENQTQGCYGLYMDNLILQKFGNNFKKKMHSKADSLFLVNAVNKTVYYGDLDERPRLLSETERHGDGLGIFYVESTKIRIMGNKVGDIPFMDIEFIVDKDSTISNFKVNNFVSDSSENFKEELFELAVSELKSNYPIWVPGKINGIALKSDNNVRIHFANK
jgi:hypothetical protein